MGSINYRAVHTKSTWRKVVTHKSLESAIYGKDGAVGLFARKVRINYATHGDPKYVVVWEQGASSGTIVRPDPTQAGGIRVAIAPIAEIHAFERRDGASPQELDRYF
ncbi:MAG: hypothetical protein IPF57_23245 [Gammaproteobacteria bacterium]|nr:hypothetical protein [Gammaproteobacteria bacterium]MBK9469803.1 hypothetical protein [Gammaproteobacteria bacterium]